MKIFFLALLTAALIIIAASYIIFCLGIVRFPKKSDPVLSAGLKNYADIIESGQRWFLSMSPETVHISAYDSTLLSGRYIRRENALGTIILMHGYRANGLRDFAGVYKYYYDLGYSILLADQRAHGESGGSYICFGVKERFDCRDWAKYISDRFGKDHDIFLGGISMGASTVLMSADLDLPGSVCGIIADCGYTTPEAEFRHFLRHCTHLPVHPFMDVAEVFCRLFAGFGFGDCSSVKSLQNTSLPVLLIHGEADPLVPCGFSRENYEACRSEKTLITVPGAGHGLSYLLEPEKCRAALKDFLYSNSRVKI